MKWIKIGEEVSWNNPRTMQWMWELLFVVVKDMMQIRWEWVVHGDPSSVCCCIQNICKVTKSHWNIGWMTYEYYSESVENQHNKRVCCEGSLLDNCVKTCPTQCMKWSWDATETLQFHSCWNCCYLVTKGCQQCSNNVGNIQITTDLEWDKRSFLRRVCNRDSHVVSSFLQRICSKMDTLRSP